MKKTNIVLTGFMAAGKTTISKILAQKLKMEVVATDEVIVGREKRSINDIFAASGEEYFREIERAVVEEMSAKENVIFDCGGGVVLSPQNIKNLKKKGVMFFLKISPEAVFERVKLDDKRPLMKVADPLAKIRELLRARDPFYAKADHIIEVDNKTFEQVADEIIGIFKNERK